MIPSAPLLLGAAALGPISALIPETRLIAWLVAGLLSGLLLLGIPLVVVTLLRRRQKQLVLAGASVLSKRELSALEEIWSKFLARLPRASRPLVARYPSVIVMGPAGAGKSQLIRSFVDWQGQTSLFLPSYTPDPLLQIYLGSHAVVQEVSATLLQQPSRESHEAFRRLWKTSLSAARPPTVVVVLKISTLQTSSPDVIRQQAQLVRGKINLLFGCKTEVIPG